MPCPFCGDTKTLRFEVDQNQGTIWGRVVCGCGVLGPDVRTQYKETGWEPEAAKEWNTRAHGTHGMEMYYLLLEEYPEIAQAIRELGK